MPAQINGDGTHRNRLIRRLVVYILLFSSLITLLSTGVQLYSEYKRDLNTIHEGLKQVEKSHLEVIIRQLWDYDLNNLKAQLSGVLQLPEVEYVEIKQQQEMIVTQGHLPKGRIIERHFSLSIDRHGKQFELGQLRVTASLQGVYKRLIHRVIIILSSQAIKTFLVTTFIFTLFYYMIGRHLTKLAQHASELDVNSLDKPFELNRTVYKETKDELDQVVDAINTMRVRLFDGLTELKRSEFNARESESKFKQLAENIPEIFWLSSPDWQEILYISPAYEKIWGKSCESLYREPKSWMESIHDSDINQIKNQIPVQWSAPLRPHVFPEYRIVQPDGTIRWIFTRVFPVVDEKGDIIRIAGLFADISELKKAEKEKNELSQHLAQAQKMESIGTLASGIAHDFNNILFPILGYSEMLITETPDSDKKTHDKLKRIFSSAIRAKELVQQILAFSRQETAEHISMKVQPILKEVVKLLEATIPKHVEIKYHIDPECGAIKADATQIHQIIMNLTTNAWHAMQSEGGRLNIVLEEIRIDDHHNKTTEIKPGNYLCLSVSDTGIGMSEQLMGKIFDPFFTTKEKGKGTGMGLSVTHGIVSKMGGYINVFSTPGQGAEFKIYIPIDESGEKRNNNVMQNQTEQTGTERILLVDDEEAIITFEKLALEKLGYTVVSESDPTKALQIFTASPTRFDLVITDMSMPKLSGDRFARKLLKIRPDLPIILCTGFSESIGSGSADKIGVKEIVMKPVSIHDLSKRIRNVFDEQSITVTG
jgi:PAS domain S-box-containing protein